MTESDASRRGSEQIERSSPSANESRDSAIQYVAIDLLESGFGPDEQRRILGPVEDEIRRHHSDALRDGMRRAFRASAEMGASTAIEDLTNRLTFEDVPEEHRADVRRLVEERLEEKVPQLSEAYHDLIEDTLRRASVTPEDQIVNWGTVV